MLGVFPDWFVPALSVVLVAAVTALSVRRRQRHHR